jgi:transposase
MLARLLRLHPSTYKRLVRLSKEAEREGAYRVAKRLQAVVLNLEGQTSGELARILKAPRSKVSEWLQRYQSDGVDGLLEGYRSGRPSELTEQQQQQLGDILDSGQIQYMAFTRLWSATSGPPVSSGLLKKEQNWSLTCLMRWTSLGPRLVSSLLGARPWHCWLINSLQRPGNSWHDTKTSRAPMGYS